jgi:hypothetical protein
MTPNEEPRRPGVTREQSEAAPSVHIDWDMTRNEWQQLRMTLWQGQSPYARQLAAEGQLGPKPTMAERWRWLIGTDRRYIGA